MWIWLAVMASGCAGVRVTAPLPPDLFGDARFALPSAPASAEHLFTLSPAMQAYLQSPQFTAEARAKGVERGLVDALYRNGDLKLDYDASLTRDAAQTFQARMGNCLSLVIMTAAFAKELKLPVEYHDVAIDEVWSRSGGLYFANTHVNLSLGHSLSDAYRSAVGSSALTVDFVPIPDAARLHETNIDEDTIVAMYMNNRAAELLAAGHIDDAYWWARKGLARYPGHLNLLNTLGVIYQRHGDLALAEKAYRTALAREPDNPHLMHNLVPVLGALGKQAEAQALTARLARLDPTPAFYYFKLGQRAMERGKYDEARRLFAKEVRRAPEYHEFHFWLALAELRLGDAGAATEQLSLAVETSNTREAGQRYSAKLAHLRSLIARPQF